MIMHSTFGTMYCRRFGGSGVIMAATPIFHHSVAPGVPKGTGSPFFQLHVQGVQLAAEPIDGGNEPYGPVGRESMMFVILAAPIPAAPPTIAAGTGGNRAAAPATAPRLPEIITPSMLGLLLPAR